MVKVIISTMLDLFSCGPCGKLKTQLQDDDADIWNDLTLAFAVPGAKPPNIPKVVKVVSDSDTDDDVSTLYESSFHNRQHNWNRRDIDDDEEEEEESSPSLTTPRRTFNNTEMKAETTKDDCSPMYGHDLELEQVLEEIDISDADDDESLESIMGPRSQVVSVTSSRHSRRTSSSLPVTFTPIPLPLPSTRPISLLQQEREQYHGMMSDESSIFLPLSARPPTLIHQEREQYHVAMSSLRGGGGGGEQEEDEEEESCSLLPLSARPPSLLQQQRERFSSIFPREDYKEEDYRDDEFFCDDHDHDDGSSYSSGCQKISFFKKKIYAFPSSNGNGNGNGKNIMWKMSSSVITSNNSGWQILQGDSTDTSSTVQTQNRHPHHILSTLRPR